MTRKSSSFRGSRLVAAAGPLPELLLALCLASPSAALAGSAPEWLSAANHVDLGHFGDGSAAVIVGQWTEFSVDATGKFTLTERRAIRVLHRKAAERYLNVIGYENNEKKVTSIETWAIDPAGHVTQSSKNDLNVVAAFAEFEMYSDDRAKMIRAPGAEDGSLVGYEVVSQGRIPIDGEAFRLESSIPIHQGELHLSVASGSMHWFSNHPDRMEVVEQSEHSATIRVADRLGIPEEPSAPPTSSLALEVVVNYDPQGALAINSWNDAGRIFHTIADPAEKPDTDIAAQVQTLISGKTDTLSKIDALYNYVSREVRYVAIEIGIGGYQPHPAADVYKNKYGDCKDKATLLMTMLDHIGLRGYPALVGTREEVEADPKMPTLATFDHFIVALPVPAAFQPVVEHFPAYDTQTKILWIDPTSEYDPLGQVPEMDQGVFALISYPDHGELRRVPEPSPLENRIQYNAHVQLQADGTGTADVKVKYWGTNNAERHAYFRGRSEESIRKTFENRVAQYANQAVFRRASISGVEDSRQQITEEFSFSGDFSTASSGDSWFFQPLFLSGIDVPEFGPRPRQLPLDIGTPEQIKVEYTIDLPAGMKIDRIPEKMQIKSEFGEVDVEYTISGNVLHGTRIISYTQSRIPPEKYPAFREFVIGNLRLERLRLRVEKITP
jgi:transglutaminase-like putative cysteine protease